jgi:hypothetical protein
MSRDAVAVVDPPATRCRWTKDVAYGDLCLVEAGRHLGLAGEDVLLDIGGGGTYYLSRLAPRVRRAVLVDRIAGMYTASLGDAQRARGHDAIAVVERRHPHGRCSDLIDTLQTPAGTSTP